MPFPTRTALIAAALLLASHAGAQNRMNQPVGLVALSPSPSPVLFATVGTGFFRSEHAEYQLLGHQFDTIYLRPPGAPQPQLTQILFEPGSAAVMYATADAAEGGVWKSVDTGVTWTPMNQGLPIEGGFVHSFQFEPGQPRTIYCVIANGVYKTVDGAASWTKAAALPETPLRFLISPHDRQLWMFATRAQVSRSPDAGATWPVSTKSSLPIAEGSTVTGMLMDAFDPAYLYISAAGQAPGVGVYRLDVMNPGNVVVQRRAAQAFSIGYPSPGSRILLITTLGPGNASCIDLTLDQGFSWGRTCIPGALGPSTLAFNTSNTSQLMAGTAAGLFKTRNGGAEWTPTFGTVKPTLAAPQTSYQFTLPPGQTGSLELTLGLAETQLWSAPIEANTAGGAWLRLTNVAGTTPAKAIVQVSAAGLTAGEYEGSITVRSSQAANSPMTVPVKLTVAAAEADPGYVVTTLAGTGSPANTGDDGPAARATLSSPDSVVVAGDGAVYVSDTGNHTIKRIGGDGVIRRAAGTGQPGVAGDGGDPRLATFQQPRGLALAPGGFYIADAGNRRIRKVENGVVSTYASGLENLRGIALGADGTLYIALPTEHVVIAVGNGTPRAVAGTGVAGFRGEGGSAVQARLSSPSDVFVDAKGDLYIADTDNNRVRVVSAADQKIRTVAGNGQAGFQAASGPALQVALNGPSGVAVDETGNVFIADRGNNRIRMVTPGGKLSTIAGAGEAGFSGEGSQAVAAMLRGPSDVATGGGGHIYFTDTQNHRVRVLAPRAGAAPAISEGGVVSAADGFVALSPGGLFSIFGANLAGGVETASSAPWPRTLRGVTVTMNGAAVPVNYVSPGQVNGQVPFELGAGEADVVVTVDGVASQARKAVVQPAAPGIFQYGVNRAVAQNANGSVNASINPARAGEVVTVYLTGIGALDNAVTTGAAAPAEPLSRAAGGVRATIGGVEAQVLYLGLTPGFIGLAQANVIVPALGAGEYAVEISIGGAAGNRPVITVRN
ncbi:MAG: hypothetical protein IT164_07015 [Bryobacterales bacterium]|nr:hypothetical protein [Bryobacterales bacterium]